VKRAQQHLFPLRRLKRFAMGSQILKKFCKFCKDLLYQAVSEEGPKICQASDCFLFYRTAGGTFCTKSGTKRTRNSFYPQAIRLVNS
jgi:hypothetical protein